MKNFILAIALAFTAVTYACDDANFTFQSEVDNGDGTYTYTFDICIEMLGLEGIPDWFQVRFSGGTFVDIDNNAWSPDVIQTSWPDDYNASRRLSNSAVRWEMQDLLPAHNSNLLCTTGITVTTNGRPENINVNFHDTYPGCDNTNYTVYTPAPCDGLTAVPTVTTTQPTCAVNTGTIEFDSQTNVEYSIDGGVSYQASTTFAGLAPGDYDLMVRSTADGSCTEAGATITINIVPSSPTVPTATLTQPTCGVPTGTIEFTAQAGVEFSIDGGVSYQASTTFTGLAAGDYDLMVRSTSDNTCTRAGATETINAVPSTPAVPTATLTQPTCGVPTGTIEFTAQAGVEFSIDGGVSYQASTTFAGLAAGDYDLMVRSTTDNSCVRAGATETINAVPSTPAVPTAILTQPTCGVSTGTIEFAAQAGVEFSIDGGVSYQASTTFAGLAAGNYDLAVRNNSDNTCETTGATIVINAVPTPPVIPSANITQQPTCAVNSGEIVFVSQAGVEYSIDGGVSYQSSVTFAGLNAGDYDLAVRSTADNTCATLGATLTIIPASGAPVAPTATSIDPTCGSPTGTIVFDSQAGVEYSIDGIVFQTSETFSGLSVGSYTITVRSTVDNSCTTDGLAQIDINAAVGAPAAPTYTITQPDCITPTGSIVFDTQVNAEYSDDGGASYQASETFTGYNPGDIIDLAVRSTLDNTCETIGASITFDPLPNITVTTIEVSHNPCFGDAVGSASLTSDGTDPVTYDWVGPISFTGNPGANLPAGNYAITATDANGCTGTLSLDINEAPSALLANSTVINSTCGIANGEITLNPSGGNGTISGDYTIQWSDDFSADNPKQNLTDGDYEVTISDIGGCVLITTISVGTSAAITVDAVNPQDASCFGFSDGSLDLSTDGALPLASVTWSDGQTTNDAVSLAAGSYTVTVVDANGCTGTSSSVDIDEPIELSATYALDSADCGIPNGQITVTPVGGTANYTVDWPVLGVLDQAVIGGLDVGGYNVLVTDANGCTFNDVVVMENPGDPNISILNQDNNLCFGDLNGSITVEADGGTAPYTFGWFDAAFNFITVGETLSGLPTGTYYVMALDDNSCSDVELLVITGPSTPVMASASTTSASCGDANGEISASALGGTAPYTYSLNGNSQSSGDFTGLGSGSQTIIVSDDNGCTDEITVALSNSDGPILDEVQIEAPNCFNGADGSAYVLVQGGLPSYTYYQDGVQVTADVHNLTSGSNQILVVDAQLCSLYVDFVVPQADSLMAVIDTNFVLGDLPLSVEADGINSIGESAYQWELNGELIGANSDVSEMIFEEGDYNLLLTVFEGICSDTTSITFTAENAYEWEIPNTFTPNGDGSNDNFRIKNSHNDFVTISIYNRWGELIYSFEGSNVNWDGRLKSGNFASAGTYFYILRYAETSDSEVSELNGYIRLVR